MSAFYDQETILKDYFELLRIPTVSADPQYADAMAQGSDWIANYLRESGVEVEVWKTPTYDTVFGHWCEAGADKPTLLLYGHYDVQPVDPIDEWESDPFEPTVRDGEVYARGAQDNKGQLIYVLAAVRALLKRDGKLPINVKFCIEGEEENKSPGLSAILPEKAEQLKADYLVSADFDVIDLQTPSITLGLRGMVAFTLELEGSNTDLHSGMAGGVVFNPLHAMAQMLAALRDEKGWVQVPGFYDAVRTLTKEERDQLNLDINPDTYREMFDAEMTGGEVEFSGGESAKIRPTLEVNGIHGGYGGPGCKTVIPARALAKLSCRLVPDQDPKTIRESLEAFLKEHCPPGIRMKLTFHGGDRANWSGPNTKIAQAARQAYSEVFGKPCQMSYSGGSVPISADLAVHSGADPLFIGVGLMDDKIHAPNEHFGIERMRLGFETTVRLIELL